MPYPCGCEIRCEDGNRPACFVDKYATGAGNGSSWTDAYTTISSALSARGATHRIYVKGYGKSDPYAGPLTTGALAQLIGVETPDEVWVDDRIAVGYQCCITRINVTRTSGANNSGMGVGWGSRILDCVVENDYGYGFGGSSASTSDNRAEFYSCVARNCSQYGFFGGAYDYLKDCVADGNGWDGFHTWYYGSNHVIYDGCVAQNNGVHGFYSKSDDQFYSCSAQNNAEHGFYFDSGVLPQDQQCVECVAEGNGGSGFYLNWGGVTVNTCVADGNGEHGFRCIDWCYYYATDCDATDNGYCGYSNCKYLISGNTASGNGGSCSGATYCDGATNPCGICDECP